VNLPVVDYAASIEGGFGLLVEDNGRGRVLRMGPGNSYRFATGCDSTQAAGGASCLTTGVQRDHCPVVTLPSSFRFFAFFSK